MNVHGARGFFALTALALLGAGGVARAGTGIQSLIPADQLAKIKAALPQVAYPPVEQIFASSNTLWYDHDVMSPSYQETGFPGGGAQDNAHWLRLIADSLHDEAVKIYDPDKLHWRFPFATTAGTDDSDNIQVENFIALPVDAQGNVTPIPIKTVTDDISRSWVWTYPTGTVVGEVIFIKDGDNLLPSEVRIRTRQDAGWTTNLFRPFAGAADLAAAVKAHRPNWQSTPSLTALVQHLGDPTTLTPLHLTATGLPGTFDQAGYLDVLPDFGDDALVRELLTTTRFVSAYGAVWKQNGDAKTYSASTAAELSIVPRNYTLGVIEITDDSCMRCHASAAKKLGDFYPDIVLYGEIWGKDAIFSFHPFDESYYPDLDMDEVDNRHINPKLSAMGVFVMADSAEARADYVTKP